MFIPKAIKREKAKRHFKRVMRREKDCLLPRKRVQYGYNKTMSRCVKNMFPQWLVEEFLKA